MWKNMRAAAFVVVLGVGATGSAQNGIQVGRDGSVKVKGGSSRVEVDPSGAVLVGVPEAQVETEARAETPRPARAGNDKQILLEGTGQNQTVTCEPGAEVTIEGTGNSYVIEGECGRLSVSGTSNKVRVRSVGSVVVEGTSNVIQWERGYGKARKPTVSTEGVNNTVSQVRSP